jgi:hypothetical protein
MQNIMKIKIFLIFLIFSLFNTQLYALDLKIESPTIKAPRPGQDISAGFHHNNFINKFTNTIY